MTQAGDWQRDVLRELGGQDPAPGGENTAPAAPVTPVRRGEPTLRLVRSVPIEPVEPTGSAESAGGPEPTGGPGAVGRSDAAVPGAAGGPGFAESAGSEGFARPVPGYATAAEEALRPGAGQPEQGVPVGPQAVRQAAFAQPQPPVEPGHDVPPPVRPGQAAQPPGQGVPAVQRASAAQPPVQTGHVAWPPSQESPLGQQPGRPTPAAQAHVQPGHAVQPPVQPGHAVQPPVQAHVQPRHAVQPPVQPRHAVQPPVQVTPVEQPPTQPNPDLPPPLQPGHYAQPPVQPTGTPPVPHSPVVSPPAGAHGAVVRSADVPGGGDVPEAPGGDGASGGVPAARGARVPQTPLRAPDSVPTIDPRLAHALGRPQHGDSVVRRTGRSIRKLASSAAQDVAEETRIARELQQPVTTGRVIAVTSIRGGVGKSTTAALLGRTFNHYRHDPVLTMEADAALGTLPVRMGADSVRWAAADLARILNPAMQLTDVTGYLVPVSDGGWLLPGSQGRVGAPLDIRTYRTVTLALRRYFAVTVVDCETLPGEVARTAMDTAHARVVVAPMTAEGVNGTRQVLDWLGQLPHSALGSTVVALTANSPDVTLDRDTAVAHLKESGVHVVPVPYDRHLAQGGPIRTALLGRETRAAAITLAAEAMTRAVRMR
ncbi:hypothetical protein [Streptomyces stelliscabiei]|uniref:MinD-like ATPase involved in chromosome partitioning or flagellar assembly n=1 Tax=Streptomyces stelliscabiei TaxID=146820 RepID=A0A8I0TR97_9ACTN|nr:hypothetical protein [Streptomyces stelliscabiei]MBE1597454.1 MinD-like ATPase involved in chromosome partitioning or flagellar assembly [Streptomyces stelliscabiei]MDX2513621.1 hypothetical protein [Streptomyces stelliscabiei]